MPQELVDELGARALWNASTDGLLIVDDDGSIRATNPALDKMFGYAPGELIDGPVEALVPAENRTDHANLRRAYNESPISRPMGASRHLEGRRCDGSLFPINVSLGRIQTAEGDLSLAAVRDLTDRVRAEAEVAKASRMHALADDHDRIARELHDTVIQRLFGVGLVLQGLSSRLIDRDSERTIGAAVDTLDDVIRDIRSTIYVLHHGPDTVRSLREQVVTVTRETEPSLGFTPEVRFSGDVDGVIDAAVVTHVIPVLREALTNVARHAGATKAVVWVARTEDRLKLEVVDDGTGVEANVVRSGLANMADRALSLGGRFEIRRAEPTGTVVCWTVPCQSADPPTE